MWLNGVSEDMASLILRSHSVIFRGYPPTPLPVIFRGQFSYATSYGVGGLQAAAGMPSDNPPRLL